MDLIEQFNISVFLFINQYAGQNSILDFVAKSFGRFTPYLFILVLIYLSFSSAPQRKKSSLNAGFSVLLAMMISFMISILYYHPRPFVLGLGTKIIDHAPDASFPSDHTSFIFSISLTLLFYKSTRGIGFILLILAFIGGFSRVFGGVHFPLDILGAFLVALFSSTIVFIINHRSNFLDLILVRGLDRSKRSK